MGTLAVEGSGRPPGFGESNDDIGEETLEEEWLGDRVLDAWASDFTRNEGHIRQASKPTTNHTHVKLRVALRRITLKSGHSDCFTH